MTSPVWDAAPDDSTRMRLLVERTIDLSDRAHTLTDTELWSELAEIAALGRELADVWTADLPAEATG